MNEYDKKIFAKNLNKYMSENNKKPKDLCLLLNVGKSTVSSWCNAEKIPRMDKIEILAKYFGILKSDLIEEKSDIVLNDTDRRFLELFKQLTDDEKNLLISTAENIIKTYHK